MDPDEQSRLGELEEYCSTLSLRLIDRYRPKQVLVYGNFLAPLSSCLRREGVGVTYADGVIFHLAIEEAQYRGRRFDLVVCHPGCEDMPDGFGPAVARNTDLVFLLNVGLGVRKVISLQPWVDEVLKAGFLPEPCPGFPPLDVGPLTTDADTAFFERSGPLNVAGEAYEFAHRPDVESLLFADGTCFQLNPASRLKRCSWIDLPHAPIIRESISLARWMSGGQPQASILERQRQYCDALQERPLVSIRVLVGRSPAWMISELVASCIAQTYRFWKIELIESEKNETQTSQWIHATTVAEARVYRQEAQVAEQELAPEVAGALVIWLEPSDLLAPIALFDLVELLQRRPHLQEAHSDSVSLTANGEWRAPSFGGAELGGPICASTGRRLVVRRGGGAPPPPLEPAHAPGCPRSEHIARVHLWRRDHLCASPLAQAEQNLSPGTGAAPSELLASVHRSPAGARRLLWRRTGSVAVILVAAAADAGVWHAVRQVQAVLPAWGVKLLLPASEWPAGGQSNPVAVETPTAWSLAERLQYGVSQCDAETLVFVDAACRPIQANWLAELTGPLCEPQIGLVGGRQLCPSDRSTVQAGLVFDVDGRLSSPQGAEPAGAFGDWCSGEDYAYRTAVGGGAFAIRRSVFDEVGGFAEPLGYPRLDVDLCLRVRSRRKLRVLYNPHAQLWRFGPPLLEDWTDDHELGPAFLRNMFPGGDPCSNPNLVLQRGRLVLRGRRRG